LKARATPNTENAYLARVPGPARGTLRKIRAAICSAAPREVVETISYGMPTFKYDGSPLVWFAAFSSHCSLFPTAEVIRKFKKELKGFHISKGTIRFPLDKPLPAVLVKKMVKARIAAMQDKQRR
jgi:uncharacterized protein YdhG (YjbR/CyaY superfamily)